MTDYTDEKLQQAQQLLRKVNVIMENYKFLEQKTGRNFNIFQICAIDKDEVRNCRLLCELLSPTGSHGQGTAYLKLFFEIVLQLPTTAAELQTANVYQEYPTDEYRRIDLVIETNSMFIPIEVKINAGEQEKQCFDYYEEAKRHNKQVRMYYLTKDSSSPSEYSAGDLLQEHESKIQTISFAEDILTWLTACLQKPGTIKLAPVREVLQQYMAAIRKFTNQMEDEQSMEIKALLMESPENMKSAIAIQESLNDAKETLMRNLFQAIEEKVGEKYQKLENEYDYAEDNYKRVRDFYKYKKTSLPGLSYQYKTAVKPGIDIWVRIEIWGYIYVGYCCVVDGTIATTLPLSYEELESILSMSLKDMNPDESEGCWAYWKYCDDKSGRIPEFKDCDDAWLALFDRKNFDSFVNQCASRIIELIER